MVVLPVLAVAMDGTSLVLALPHLSIDLGATSTEQLWIVDINVFMLAGFVIVMGRLGDLIGHRRLLLIAAALFGGGSLVGADSASVKVLIGVRAVMGASSAALLSSSLALVSVIFSDPRRRALGITIRTSAAIVGAAMGPAVGGLLLQYL